jgi:Protein of unknown function (DUF1236)
LAGGNVPRVNNVNFSLRAGTTVPTSVRVVEVPPALIEIHPQWRGHMYFVVGDQIIIVDRNHRIVAVIEVWFEQPRETWGGLQSEASLFLWWTHRRAEKAPLTWGEFRDGTVYLVLDDFGELGSAYRETDAAQPEHRILFLLQVRHVDFAAGCLKFWRRSLPSTHRGSALICTSGKGHGSRAAPAKSIKPSLVK